MAIGSLALTTLQACGPDQVASAGDTPVVVQVDDTPPGDLLRCPEPPVAFPLNQAATMPADVRSALMSLAFAYAATLDQLERLINWERPDTCPDQLDAEAR
jgi:hypothetical protein